MKSRKIISVIIGLVFLLFSNFSFSQSISVKDNNLQVKVDNTSANFIYDVNKVNEVLIKLENNQKLTLDEENYLSIISDYMKNDVFNDSAFLYTLSSLDHTLSDINYKYDIIDNKLRILNSFGYDKETIKSSTEKNRTIIHYLFVLGIILAYTLYVVVTTGRILNVKDAILGLAFYSILSYLLMLFIYHGLALLNSNYHNIRDIMNLLS